MTTPKSTPALVPASASTPMATPAPVPPFVMSWVNPTAFTKPEKAHLRDKAEYICEKAGKELKRIGQKFDSIKIVYVVPFFHVGVFYSVLN